MAIEIPLASIEVDAPALPALAPEQAPLLRRILVVEDNADAAESMRLLLEGFGHHVTVVHSGIEAVAVAKLEMPDVVVLDIGLPGMDGYRLAALLRQMPELPGARIIAVSGYGRDNERSSIAGFDDHLVKPVDPARLLRAISPRAPAS